VRLKETETELIKIVAERFARWISAELVYRVLASLMGIAVGVVLGDGEISRPSEVVQVVARWTGLDLGNDIDAWVQWVTAPERSGVTQVSGVIVVVGLMQVAISATQRRTVWSGAACLTLIAFGVYLEARGDAFAFSWAVAIAAIIVWCAWCVHQGDDDAPVIALSDLFLTAVWLPVLLLACAVSLPQSADHASE
jgi:hypothetical protein